MPRRLLRVIKFISLGGFLRRLGIRKIVYNCRENFEAGALAAEFIILVKTIEEANCPIVIKGLGVYPHVQSN